MKIVHCCLSNFYIDGFSYQENELVAQNISDGHEVTVIASTETYDSSRKLAYLSPGEYKGEDGAKVIRLAYRKFLPAPVMRKLRLYPNFFNLLAQLKPDVILFHGTCAGELATVTYFKYKNPAIKLYVDSHEDFHNSARTWASKWLLHFCYYRSILRVCSPWVDKILCVNMAAISFVNGFYGVPREKIEFYPLGGRTLSDEEYELARTVARGVYDIEPEDTVFIQSGKIDKTKKLVEALHAFILADDPDSHFLIAGHLQDDIYEEVNKLLSVNNRIRFLGWKTPDELRALLCAADVYVQPGTQSATMQMSLCCRCVVILDDVPSHQPFVDGNGWLVSDRLMLEEAFRRACESKEQLHMMAEKSADVAARLLDYRSLAARLYI